MKKAETKNESHIIKKGSILLIRKDLKAGELYRKTYFSKEMEPFKGTLVKVKKVYTDGSFAVYENNFYFTPEMVEKVVKKDIEKKTKDFPIILNGNYIVRDDLTVGKYYGGIKFTSKHADFLQTTTNVITIKKIFLSGNFYVTFSSLCFSPEMLRPIIAGCGKLYGQTAKPLLISKKEESGYGTPDLEAGDKILIRKDLIFDNKTHYGEIILSKEMTSFLGNLLTVKEKSKTLNAYFTKETGSWLWSPEMIEKVIKGKKPYETIIFNENKNEFNPIAEYDPQRTFKNEPENTIIDKSSITIELIKYSDGTGKLHTDRKNLSIFETTSLLRTFLRKLEKETDNIYVKFEE